MSSPSGPAPTPPSSAAAPATPGGSSTPSTTGGSRHPAETGGSSARPDFGCYAIALVVVGGGAVFLLR
ncbi:LAETG motif-containing sortase-dependent surface protein, partial [Streptomyces sp. JV184]|uniref:LAETG motif-containing sortase-dependent surface protein n=1 Tax=Streptomyces sp. JV184 TaxID=858637 RepID=UPI002E7847AD